VVGAFDTRGAGGASNYVFGICGRWSRVWPKNHCELCWGAAELKMQEKRRVHKTHLLHSASDFRCESGKRNTSDLQVNCFAISYGEDE
jgi:hypothetical protein